MESQDKDNVLSVPYSILRAAIKEVPPVKYALGVAGVGAAVAIILGLLRDPKIAVFGILVVIVLMTVLVIFSHSVQDVPGKRWLAATFAWAMLLLFIATLILVFTSFTFGFPQRLASYLGNVEQVQGSQITASKAKDHIGETATVCGVVASANYAVSSQGQPTFLNLDKPFPNQVFTAVIWKGDRPKFGQPETELKDKRICVTGTIKEDRRTPEIILRDPNQLKVE